jgi:hypothetical protein
MTDAPLRPIVERGFLQGPGGGWWDRLDCGHMLHYGGSPTSARRRCHECITDPPGMTPLFDTATLPNRKD